MNRSELLESSDSSDEDYLPDKKSEMASDTDSDGKPDCISSDEEGKAVPRKRTKHNGKPRKKTKNAGSTTTAANDDSKQASEHEKKKIEEDIWADFMRDTGFQSRNNKLANVNSDKPKSEIPQDCKLNSTEGVTEKVKITEIFEFAGENVTVEREVPKSSSEDRLSTTKEAAQNDKSKCKSHLSGISGILNQLGRKTKINTLEKSKLDWDRFKKEENLEEELQTHNRGKDGYLEKQDFLERADLRRFEIEKKIRTIERNKRVNNS